MQRKLANVFLFATLVNGQPAAPQKPGKVEGLVTNSVTGDPVKKAIVNLQALGQTGSFVTNSDAGGHFHFDSVTPGNYQITASRTGFVLPQESVQAEVFQKPLIVGEEQQIKDLVVKLLPLAVVSGSVLDEDGDPIAGATVLALVTAFTRQGKLLSPAGFARTNDLGEYRFLDLSPGRYYFQATAPQRQIQIPPKTRSAAPEEIYPITYYPNALQPAQATVSLIAPRAHVTNIEFHMRRIRSFHVRGKVVDSQTGMPMQNATVFLRSSESKMFAQTFVRTEKNGTFDVTVGNGAYVVSAQGIDGKLARKIVTVGGQDVNDVLLVMQSPLLISGTMRVGGNPLENKSGMQVNLQSDDGSSGAQPNVENDGCF